MMTLALNNPRRLICHKKERNQTIMTIQSSILMTDNFFYWEESLKITITRCRWNVLGPTKKYILLTLAYTWRNFCPVGWGCRIHWLLLCRGVRPPLNECPDNDTKHSDGEVPAVLEFWGMRSTPSLPLLPGPLWPGVVAPDRALSMD